METAKAVIFVEAALAVVLAAVVSPPVADARLEQPRPATLTTPARLMARRT